VHRTRFQKERKIQKSDFFEFLFFPFLLICLDALEASADYEENEFEGES